MANVKNKTIRRLKNIILGLLLLMVSLLLVFSLLSGAEKYDSGFHGIIQNSPNALPWLALYLVIYAAWKWELIGGIILISFGIISFFFFNVLSGNIVILLMVVFPLIIAGMVFIWHWHINRS